MTTKFDVGEVVNIRAIVTGIIITGDGKTLYEINLRSASGFGITQVVEENSIIKEVQDGNKVRRVNERR